MTTPSPQSGQKSPQEGPKSRSRGRMFVVLFVLAVLAISAVSVSTNLSRLWSPKPGDVEAKASQGSLERLEIVSGEKRHVFFVEVAANDKDRARGLMFRRSMPQDNGMIFDFKGDQVVTMWMKNTFIPLDMIFLHADGRIHRIEERTEPQSERTISSGVPVRGVLELNGGVAASLGLKAGDRILHRLFR